MSLLRSFAWIIPLTASFAVAQTATRINCKQNPALCEIEIGGQTLTLGMPEDRAREFLSRTPYQLGENRPWSAEHKPESLWYPGGPEHQPFAGAIKGGVKFKAGKLDGVMVVWNPYSDEQADFAANLINLLERFSKEGSTSCTLSTTTTRPEQEDTDAVFQCGLRMVDVSHSRFQSSFQGQKLPGVGQIFEMLGNW